MQMRATHGQCSRSGTTLPLLDRRQRRRYIRASAKTSKRADAATKAEPGLGLKAAWTAAEQFGNVVGLSSPSDRQETKSRSGAKQISREDAIAAIKADYDADYFISGTGEMGAYAEDCYFADPFAGFKGTERFVKNVRNLGGMLDDVRIDITEWTEEADFLRARWRFSSILRVPWRPVLAAAGSTTHKFDPDSGLVVEHIEAWDTEPWPVIKRLLKPSSKQPSTRWESFMLAVSRGDVGGSWLAVSDRALLAAAPLAALAVGARVAFGGHGQGGVVAVLEVVVVGTFLAAAAAELTKLSRS